MARFPFFTEKNRVSATFCRNGKSAISQIFSSEKFFFLDGPIFKKGKTSGFCQTGSQVEPLSSCVRNLVSEELDLVDKLVPEFFVSWVVPGLFFVTDLVPGEKCCKAVENIALLKKWILSKL